MHHKIKNLSLAVALGLTALTGCQQHPVTETPAAPAVNQVQASAAFDRFADQFIDGLWDLAPTWAVYSGNHDYDHLLTIPNDASRKKLLAFVEQRQRQLAAIDKAALSDGQRIDAELIANQLKSLAWDTTTFKSWQWDPSQYNVAGGFAQLLNGQYAPAEQRLRAVMKRMKNVPAYYSAARANINNPTLEHSRLALRQNQGALAMFSDEVLQQARESSLSDEEKTLFERRLYESRQAVMSHVDWLKKLVKGLERDGARSFRIGEQRYEEKFALDIQSDLTAKQLYNKALADKEKVLSEMGRLADQLWPKYFPNQPKPAERQVMIRTLIDKLSAKHVKRDDFVEEIRAQIPTLVDFINAKQLLTLDPEKPLVVRETPEYMRGFAGASISAPGPYDKKANTYYNVTPLDNMSDAQAESYLREYNHWILQVLNIHEAIPGHYTQLVYANMSPSLIKSLLGNGAMIEGWAVYTERMMLEEGYGDFEPELWLMYYKWNLRVITNTILDYSIHVKGISKDEGLSLMIDDAFQQQAEANGKWHRATVSQVQLTSYYSGYRDIYDFRSEYQGLKGDDYSVSDFHDKFLSYGSAPVKYIRQLMLADTPSDK